MKIRTGFVSNSSSSSFVVSYPKSLNFEESIVELFKHFINIPDPLNGVAHDFLTFIDYKEDVNKEQIQDLRRRLKYDAKRKYTKFECPCDGDGGSTITNLFGKGITKDIEYKGIKLYYLGGY
jgi:hypothetical protein